MAAGVSRIYWLAKIVQPFVKVTWTECPGLLRLPKKSMYRTFELRAGMVRSAPGSQGNSLGRRLGDVPSFECCHRGLVSRETVSSF
jgi:hypothetical protein